ncbi:hypothetical protein ICN84_03080 [Akkermansia glycaniphila]|uniref:hypothetical protein n=1 Tax=Akkermansia glycaniphila TaxID=1679444 RepID=UPI001C02668B|nr:hypothetical protein [Akkermansia glycaniphila]MBT9449054.1 hypothetical protein [Akkermansia glycaniphila]
MEIAWKIVLFSLGVVLILAVVRSGAKVAFMNYPSSEFISRTISRTIYSLYRLFLSDRRGYVTLQKRLYWFSPLFLFGMILAYFGIMLFGFALIYWSVGAEASLANSCLASGSALSTLGFYTPHMVSGEVISIIEGGFGLGVVVFLITFIPGYQSAVQQREDHAACLYARTNQSPDCESFYRWIVRFDLQNSMSAIWLQWEDYIRMIGDTHCDSPVLLFTPSTRTGQSWVVVVQAVLDAANFAASALQPQHVHGAKSCLQEGIYSMTRVAQSNPIRYCLPQNDGVADVVRGDFNTVCRHLASLGFELKDDLDAAWNTFDENRKRYESALTVLAHLSFVPMDHRLVKAAASNDGR